MKRTILVILDGWGIGDKSKADAIYNGETPYFDKLLTEYPNSQLCATGECVGLPQGVMGNSEVGHMNIGAGRVVYQDLVRINQAIETGEFEKNPVLTAALEYAEKNKKAVHFLGLLSDGGVHSMNTHLYKLCEIANQYDIDDIFIHVLTDGRDTDPHSGIGYLKELIEKIKNTKCKIATITGRYYTMDRDKRWERIKVGYDAMLYGKGKFTADLIKSLEESYAEGITDEFVKPIVHIDETGVPVGTVKKDDVFIAYNFRTDRLRQITYALTQKDLPEYGMQTLPLYYVTMTRYDDKFENIKVLFDKPNLKNTLGELISNFGKKQLRIAETEKYAHVTFFFSGGREEPFEGEDRILVHSPKVATYDLKPQMSAFEVKDKVVEALKKQIYDLVVLNFANGDMVGHTGVYDAILKAVAAVDKCLEEVTETAKQNGYSVLIIADHGNADNAINPDGSPNTQHSLNPVPCILVDDDLKHVELKNGVLADVAPTICNIMQIDKPVEMTGNSLIIDNSRK